MATPDTPEPSLLVQVGDVIIRGRGDHAMVVMIIWTSRSDQTTPVDALCLVPPVGDGQFMGTAMLPSFMTYLGWLRPTEAEVDAAIAADDDFAAREGHTWQINQPGYRHVSHQWWECFRQPPTT